MKIKIETLTPIHIGSGKEISPLEYLIEGFKFHKIDMDSLFKDPEFSKYFEKFIKEVGTARYIGNIINPDLLKKHINYSIEIEKETKEYLENNFTRVKEFIKSAGRVFIPGSSLKGAILSAVLWKKGVEKVINYLYDKLQEDLLGEISEVNQKKFSKWLMVSDSDLKAPKNNLEISLSRVYGGKKDDGIPVLYETIKVGTIFELEIKTSLDNYYRFGKLKEEEILKYVDEFYKKLYEKEKTKSPIKQNLPEIPKDGYLIRIGQGCTVYSTSYLLLAEDLSIKSYSKRPPKTRKLISKNIPMGWAKISILN